jgi:hypothetical protein
MQQLLMSVRFGNIQSTHGSIQALLHNLVRYPADRDEIYYTLRVCDFFSS